MTQAPATDLGWRPRPTLTVAVATAAPLLVLAVMLARVDLLLIALPIVVWLGFGLLRRADRRPGVALGTDLPTQREGQRSLIRAGTTGLDDIDLARIQLSVTGWYRIADGDRTVGPRAPEAAPLEFELQAQRWGRGELGPAYLSAVRGLGLLGWSGVAGTGRPLATAPLTDSFDAIEAMPFAGGVVGAHRSRRPGEGGDLAGVRPFVIGDRLHRINWRVSARTDDLQVTATYSDRDTEVALVIDPSIDVGVSAGIGVSASTLDVAVRASGAIAEHYLRHGDRVGVVDLSRPARSGSPRSGRGQLFRIIAALLELKTGEVAESAIHRALSALSPRALTIIMTPLLDSKLAGPAGALARAGRSVLVVDTLPDDVRLPDVQPWTELAWRITLLQRANLVQSLQQHGVPVVSWRGRGSLDEVLVELSRTSRAPRVRR